MGVKSLWEIVGPAARPVKLEALLRKKLAVDASIWIYQFLKAVRDKEGNALGQSHIVGFFRRICKLLFFGILPLFVFDGGAPALKRQVIQNRREKREGNRENMATTAQKLLAMRLQRKMETRPAPAPRKSKTNSASAESATPPVGDQEFTYLEDMPLQHNQAPVVGPHVEDVPDSSPQRPFRKKDEYDLPDIKSFKVRKGDQRIMPKEEYDEYDDNNNWDVVDGIPVDSVDPSSREFAELPMATQYMILSHLRLRSRLRLGYTKDQLEELFPQSQDFSRFQIEQVQKRNYYTQKLMNVSGMAEDTDKAKRLAGDKDKLYVLVKNDDGWTLSLGEADGDKPIDLDTDDLNSSPLKSGKAKKAASSVASDSDDDQLEEVSLGGDADDEHELAIVRSIYEKYEGDEDPPAKIIPRNELADFDPHELQLAIDESKKDYELVKKKEDKAIETFLDATQNSGFDLGQSILFATEKKADDDHPKNESIQTPHIQELPEVESPKAEVKDSPQIHEEIPLTPARATAMPTWFGQESQLSNPHQGFGFIPDQESKEREMNAEEEMGILDWSEAKEMMKKNLEDDENNLGDDNSDLEIMEEVQLQEPEKVQRDEQNNNEDHGVEELVEDVSEQSLQEVPNVQAETHTREVPKSKQKKKPNTKKQAPNVASGNVIKNAKDTEPDLREKPVELAPPEPANKSKQQESPKKSAILDYDFEEEDEELLMKLMDEEELEHAHFTSNLRSANIPISTTVTEEQLLQEKLLKARRDAEEVTETMINDVQELLKRFGIPFITAPMEAEAQCAKLYSMGMVDGIITDDSDCFLFGGSRVYKNMFNQKQYVECYIAEDIEHKCGLDREKLIELALLLGSDYTEGIKGIGPVLAMEILAEFGNLKNFKKWFDLHAKTTAKASKESTKLQKTLLGRIRNGKLFLPDSFPDSVVANAYKNAEVDSDDSMFKWGIPRLDHIRSFLMYNVRWSQERVDEVMVPLIQNMNRQRQEGKQSTIGEFFPQEYISYKKDVGLGKRMKVAARKLKGDEAK